MPLIHLSIRSAEIIRTEPVLCHPSILYPSETARRRSAEFRSSVARKRRSIEMPLQRESTVLRRRSRGTAQGRDCPLQKEHRIETAQDGDRAAQTKCGIQISKNQTSKNENKTESGDRVTRGRVASCIIFRMTGRRKQCRF